jgi:hypothetical protein
MRNRVLVHATAISLAVLCGIALDAVGRDQQPRADEGSPSQPASASPAVKPGSLVYADFENASEDGKPVSSRGGAVNVWSYQEQPTRPAVFKGPNRVRTSKMDENHAAQFEYAFVIPNEWAGVTMEIQGQPGPAGNLPQDDVSGFKHMNLQAYVTGTSYMRVEVMSNGQQINLHSGYPMTTFKLKDGFNTYKVPLKAFAQPSWVQDSRIDPKVVLKALTSITLSVYCEQVCRPDKGMVIVDNIAFEK